MATYAVGPDDWDDQKKEDDNEEDLQALGMTIRDSDAAAVDDEDEDAVPVVPIVADDADEEPLDGLAALEKLEKELQVEAVDLGEDE